MDIWHKADPSSAIFELTFDKTRHLEILMRRIQLEAKIRMHSQAKCIFFFKLKKSITEKRMKKRMKNSVDSLFLSMA